MLYSILIRYGECMMKVTNTSKTNPLNANTLNANTLKVNMTALPKGAEKIVDGLCIREFPKYDLLYYDNVTGFKDVVSKDGKPEGCIIIYIKTKIDKDIDGNILEKPIYRYVEVAKTHPTTPRTMIYRYVLEHLARFNEEDRERYSVDIKALQTLLEPANVT